MSKQQTSQKYFKASPAQLHAIYGERAQSLRHVVVWIDQDAIQDGDIGFFIDSCFSIPDGVVAYLVFSWNGTPLEDVWRVQPVQQYVRTALGIAPKILAGLCSDQRQLVRRCVLGNAGDTARTIRQSVRYPLWLRMCLTAGVSPWE